MTINRQLFSSTTFYVLVYHVPSIFHRISSAVARIFRRDGLKIVVYLDDFLGIGKSESECRNAQSTLINLLISLGFAISWAKVVYPTKRVKFLGYILDSHLKRVELPLDKISCLTELCSEYSRREKLSKRDLHVVSGHMCYAAKAVYGARTFSRLFIDELVKLNKLGHRVRITSRLLNEFFQWINNAPIFNGLCPSHFVLKRKTVTVTTDESFSSFGSVLGSVGCRDLVPFGGLH